jgi:hypothetical protein
VPGLLCVSVASPNEIHEWLHQVQGASCGPAEIPSKHAFTIEPSGTDRYGRTLARFMIGEKSAGEMLVELGLARPCEVTRRSDAAI